MKETINHHNQNQEGEMNMSDNQSETPRTDAFEDLRASGETFITWAQYARFIGRQLTAAKLDAERLARDVRFLIQLGKFQGLAKRGTRMASPVLFANETLAEHDKAK